MDETLYHCNPSPFSYLVWIENKIKWHCWISTLSSLHPLHSELPLAVSSPQGRIRGPPKVIFSPVSCDFLLGLHILHNTHTEEVLQNFLSECSRIPLPRSDAGISAVM